MYQKEFNILKVVLVPSQKENRVIHRVKKKGRKKDSRFINIKIFVLKAGGLKGTTRIKRFREKVQFWNQSLLHYKCKFQLLRLQIQY